MTGREMNGIVETLRDLANRLEALPALAAAGSAAMAERIAVLTEAQTTLLDLADADIEELLIAAEKE